MQIIVCIVLPLTKKKVFKEFTVNWKYKTIWAVFKGHTTEPGAKRRWDETRRWGQKEEALRLAHSREGTAETKKGSLRMLEEPGSRWKSHRLQPDAGSPWTLN